MKNYLPFNVERLNKQDWRIFSILGDIVFTFKSYLEDYTNIGIYAYENFTVEFPIEIFESIEKGNNLSKKEMEKTYSLFSFVMWLICPTIATYTMNIEKVSNNTFKLHTPFQKIPMEFEKKEKGKYVYSVLHFTIALDKPLDYYVNVKNRYGKEFGMLESFSRWFDDVYKMDVSVADSFSNYEGLYEQRMLVRNDFIATIPVNMYEINSTISYAPFSIQYPIGNKPTTGLVFKENNNCIVFINGVMKKMSLEAFENGFQFKELIELKEIPKRNNLLFNNIYFNITKDNVMLLDCSNLVWKNDVTVNWKESVGSTMTLFYYNFIENYYGKRELTFGEFNKELRGYEVSTKGLETRTGLHTSEIMRVNFKNYAVA